MTREQLYTQWKAEEEIAHIHGWDFSHLDGRLQEPIPLPWNYREIILSHLQPHWQILDLDTGGGEFLLSLQHPHGNTAAAENYPPNVALCRETLLPLGIDFRPANASEALPFEDNRFDLVIDRHGDFHPAEIHRVLKPGGLFITQQVGAENDRTFVELLCGDTPLPFPEQYLSITSEKFQNAGFTILEEAECFRPMVFSDVGALVWFARVLPWEFPDFAVDTHLKQLYHVQTLLEEAGKIEGLTHRFLLVARKNP